MRRLAVLAFVAACGRNDGVQLAISAPDIPGGGTVSIVLAEQKVTAVSDQRIAPADWTGGETVQYLAKEDTGGDVMLDAFDGAVVQIEPGDAPGDYVPVLLVRDENGNLIAAGAVVDDHGVPYAVPIVAGTLVKVPLTLVPLTPNAHAGGIEDGHSLLVTCADTQSGYAWRPPHEPELRLMLAPDHDPDTNLPVLDLDCDGADADTGDCDDVNSAFNPDAVEACDGMDTNCDQQEQLTFACTDSVCPQATMAVQLCDDKTGEYLNDCEQQPICQCAADGPCETCTLSVDDHSGGSFGQPCSPSVGAVLLGGACDGLDSCTIQVFGDARWDAKVASPGSDGFAEGVTLSSNTVPPDTVMLKVQHQGGPFTSASPGVIGGVVLVVTPANVTIPIELFDTPMLRDGCDASTSDGATMMTCE